LKGAVSERKVWCVDGVLECIVQVDKEREGPYIFLFLMGLSREVMCLFLLGLSSLSYLCLHCMELVSEIYFFVEINMFTDYFCGLKKKFKKI
jgi:hypothetical protein